MADDELNEVENFTPVKNEKGSPFVTLLLILNFLGLSSVAFFQYRFFQMEKSRPNLTALLNESRERLHPDMTDENKMIEEVQEDNLFELSAFTVNLAQGDGPRRYIRLNAVLKLSVQTEFSELEARKPQIRDTVINILNSKRPEDLLKREGKFNLKEEIKSAINSFLIDGKILDIFYVNFQIN